MERGLTGLKSLLKNQQKKIVETQSKGKTQKGMK